MSNISAIIILYNPDIIKLEHLFWSVVNQVDSIIFVDNSPKLENRNINKRWVDNLSYPNIHYISMNDNLGIATAQNQGVEYAINTLNISHILLLDQDSVLPQDMVEKLVNAGNQLQTQGYKVAGVAPSYIDKKVGKLAKVVQYQGYIRKWLEVVGDEQSIQTDHVIASGLLISIDAWRAIGSFREELFIDYVDTEWCLRAKQKGYCIFVIPSVVMNHDIGDRYVKLGERDVVLHSDFRNYFTIRNSTYLILFTDLPINFKIVETLKIPFYVCFYSIHSQNKLKSLKIILIGLKDGIIKKMGKGYFENKGL